MIRTLLLFLLMSLNVFVTACGGGHKASAPIVENLYVQHMKDFTHVGVEAMHQERWASAEHAFERALQMAKLANDPAKMTSAWYNVAMAYKAGKQGDKSKAALQKVLYLAQMHDFSAYKSRAELQLALLHVENTEGVPSLSSNLPADVYLMAAQLAYLKHDLGQAEQAYIKVIETSGKDRSGLLLQAKAVMGLALLARENGDGVMAKEQSLKALKLCKQVGAPRLSADASLLLAGMEHQVSVQEQRDYAERAMDIYLILQDEIGEVKAKKILESLGE